MSLKEYSKDQIEEMSMIDLAAVMLEEKREAVDFNDLFHEIADMKGYTEKQKENYIAQFYTDMNIDGGFMTIGTNKWGLKRWYPVEQMEEEISNLPKKRKKKKPKRKVKEKTADEALFEEDLEEDLGLDDEDLNLDESDDGFEGDYDNDDLDEEEEEVIEDDISFIGDDDEEDDDL
ncbi:DNA-directed RNA polymerase subunit delta [Thalassobacillus cyri]|uniref:Probable DNA-directed RNA polymerase subunit delta n=1 Tax=Thalassobacillus cyri TaxID=571932 RepID=A0A1H4DDI4_9BACI|nr:DNA-directed RNA polymerase subunit delta [Thalassobacillus cyri]SEA70510.1 DNA-directed RNA polymerase subunit delta [Thalassobacillus cyri]